MLLPLALLTGVSGTAIAQTPRSRRVTSSSQTPSVPRRADFPIRKPTTFLRPDEYLPVNQLRAGMRGYGLTVFHGTQIERFDVTVLGVLRKVNNGRDLIMVKLGGANLSRVTDVIAGMSGSPVYVNGRIIGAVSYGDTFTRESIGYLTPISDMVEVWDASLPQDVVRAQDGIVPPATKSKTNVFPHLRPLATKIMVAGVPSSRFAKAAEMLARFNLEAQPGGGAMDTANAPLHGAKPKAGAPLLPGGAIAMSLATGDIDLTAIGTLTYRQGKRVVAFGHPFMGIGPLDAPMSTAYIHDILPSLRESTKIGSPVALVGAFSQDRPFSVGGTIGAVPRMVPIEVRVNDRSLGRSRVFHARLLRHPLLTPQLVSLAADTAISEIHGQPGDVMATVTTTVEAEEVGTITRTNRVFASVGISDAATGDLNSLMSTLAANSLYPVGVRRVVMEVGIEAGRKTAQVERVTLRQSHYEPGDLVQVGVIIKPYKRPAVPINLSFRLPATLPNGAYPLTVNGGASGGGGSISIGSLSIPLGTLANFSPATSVNQLVRRYLERDKNNDLVARLTLPTTAVTVQGERFPNLPPTLEGILRTTRTSALRVERDEVKTTLPTEWVLSGAQTVVLRVARRGEQVGGGRGVGNGPTGNASAIRTFGGTSSLAVTAPGASAPNDESAAGSFSGEPRTSEPLLSLPLPPTDKTIPGAPVKHGDTKTDKADTAKDDKAVAPRSVVRGASVWQQQANEFRQGTLAGLQVTATGDLEYAPTLRRLAESTVPYLWSAVAAGGGEGNLFVGAGDNGAVYHLQNGQFTVYAQTGEVMVHALARAQDGTLYAATAPSGKVFRITGDGKAHLLWQPTDRDERYALALTLSPNNKTLYVATGGVRGRVIAVPTEGGRATVLYDGGESHITALLLTPNGDLYAGTAPSGLVVQVAKDGVALSPAVVVCDLAEAAVSGLAQTNENGMRVLYATTASPGSLYRIVPGERVIPIPLPDHAIGALVAPAWDSEGTLWTASGNTLYGMDKANMVRVIEAPEDVEIVSLQAMGGMGGNLVATTANMGAVYVLNRDTRAGGTLLSSVLDAKGPARWGTIRTLDNAGNSISAAQVTDPAVIVTRSGNTAVPDTTWSAWSNTVGNGSRIASPPARYLQYRATLTASGAALRQVEIFYQTANQSPQVTIVSPHTGDIWRGSKTARWGGVDPDQDTLTYELALSRDNGKTWVPATLPKTGKSVKDTKTDGGATVNKKGGANVVPTGDSAKGAGEGERTVLAQVQAELDKHPEIGPEMRARILGDAPGQIRDALKVEAGANGTAINGSNSGISDGATQETSETIDTTRFADGVYLLRVTASDKTSNAVGALTTEKIAGPFRIVNHAPTLALNKAVVAGDRTVQLTGTARQTGAVIRAVQYRVDGGNWMATAPTDGLFDSSEEPFTLTTDALAVGTHMVEVQAQDEAGNLITAKQSVTVP